MSKSKKIEKIQTTTLLESYNVFLKVVVAIEFALANERPQVESNFTR
jgi:hypothetical protein